VTQKIPNDITPKNRLLMGEYLKSESDFWRMRAGPQEYVDITYKSFKKCVK
jgi:hypothetical protein